MVLSPSPPLSPTADQGVTTHLATVCNSQPSHLTSSTQTGLRSSEESLGGKSSSSRSNCSLAVGNGCPSHKLVLNHGD